MNRAARFLLLSAFLAAPAAGAGELPSKLGLRLSNGLLLNTGEIGGSSITLGGIGAAYTSFFVPNIAGTLSYTVDFNFSGGSIPIHGPAAAVKYYWRGEGTYDVTDTEGVRAERRQLSGYFGGLELAHKSYFLGTNSADAPGVDLTGTYWALNLVGGADLPLNRHFEINIEGTLGALVFSGSDDRYKIRSILVALGISYLW